jgi:hypothetical protein
VNAEAHLVTSEASQKLPKNEPDRRMPEVDNHAEAQASIDKPEPSKEVVQEEVDQEKDGEEKEVEQDDAGEGSKKINDEENVLVEEEKLSDEEEASD